MRSFFKDMRWIPFQSYESGSGMLVNDTDGNHIGRVYKETVNVYLMGKIARGKLSAAYNGVQYKTRHHIEV